MTLSLIESADPAAHLQTLHAARRDLRRMGLGLECAAASLTGIAQRCEAGQAPTVDFEIAAEAHGFARDNFRDALERASGLSAATIERWLAL